MIFKALLFSVMAMSIQIAKATEWQQIGDATDGSTYHVEPSSLKKTSKGFQIWTLASLATPKDGFSSARTLFEFNCKTKKHQIIDMAFYSEAMGLGTQVKNIVIPKAVWTNTDPDSTEGAFLDYTCQTTKTAH